MKKEGKGMLKKRELYVYQVVVAAMGPQDRFLAVHRTRKSESLYVCLVNQQGKFVTFRISSHAAKSGFLSIPTFAMTHRERLEAQLRLYLPKASWTPLTYADYFVLSVMIFSHRHHVYFQIDDLYGIFTEEKEGMLFYQVRDPYKHKRIVVNGVEETTNRVMRKLFAFGLIASLERSGETPSLYVSEIGMQLLDYYASTYVEQFTQDYQKLDWSNVRVSQEADLASVKDPEN
ncbi:hypothetical protein FD25_GL002391 [Levilactobacillus acidifarinae DSM 19394]|uniref:Uncharacterized protein n=2 Tax=Levilactobacillus acidifarinae TaxID=267364 RepID=A0A0R1LJ28_9LACO|nr:hypothetical protein [Levilactobacillus acidifarinae]KRK95931.1 hypothetical protein FD25_GL002391 [Levilactobacillus acidifarinae DSM 19394]